MFMLSLSSSRQLICIVSRLEHFQIGHSSNCEHHRHSQQLAPLLHTQRILSERMTCFLWCLIELLHRMDSVSYSFLILDSGLLCGAQLCRPWFYGKIPQRNHLCFLLSTQGKAPPEAADRVCESRACFLLRLKTLPLPR